MFLWIGYNITSLWTYHGHNPFLEMFHATSVYHVHTIIWNKHNGSALPSLHHCNIVSVMMSASLSGSQSLLPAVRLRPARLRREAHRYGDDEGHPGDPVVEVHGLSSSRLHRQHHQADQQPLHAARGRGSGLPGHALHTTRSEYPRRTTPERLRKNTEIETFKGARSNFLSPINFQWALYVNTALLYTNSWTYLKLDAFQSACDRHTWPKQTYHDLVHF